jgi:hypothetical protein
MRCRAPPICRLGCGAPSSSRAIWSTRPARLGTGRHPDRGIADPGQCVREPREEPAEHRRRFSEARHGIELCRDDLDGLRGVDRLGSASFRCRAMALLDAPTGRRCRRRRSCSATTSRSAADSHLLPAVLLRSRAPRASGARRTPRVRSSGHTHATGARTTACRDRDRLAQGSPNLTGYTSTRRDRPAGASRSGDDRLPWLERSGPRRSEPGGDGHRAGCRSVLRPHLADQRANASDSTSSTCAR